MRIGITDNERSKNHVDRYAAWIKNVDPSVELLTLSHGVGNLDLLKSVDGLILSGGGDVHPSLYGMDKAIGEVEEVDESRDAFEMQVVERALENDMPVLGICRGMQVMNVYLGGTLHIDLPSAGFRDHGEHDGVEGRHPVQLVPHSMLEIIAGRGPHEVNSHHHQAADALGKGLMMSAVSQDGVIEAAEWILKDRMPFLLLLQWHPERLNAVNPCSRNIAEYFLKETSRFSLHRQLRTIRQ